MLHLPNEFYVIHEICILHDVVIAAMQEVELRQIHVPLKY